jgi:hypothetical protein
MLAANYEERRRTNELVEKRVEDHSQYGLLPVDQTDRNADEREAVYEVRGTVCADEQPSSVVF